MYIYSITSFTQNKGRHLISFLEAARLFLDGRAVSHLWNLGKSVHWKKLAEISIHNHEVKITVYGTAKIKKMNYF